MARETKQDRIVRAINEQVNEHLHELRVLETNDATKELDVERWAQSFLRNCLGFTASSSYQIRAQETKGKMRPDLVILKNDKPIFVMEIKKLNFDLNKSDFRSGKVQLNEYLNAIGNVKWGILSNGHEWRLYDFSQPQYGGIEVFNLDFRSDNEQIDLNKKAVEELCYELMNLHESSFTSNLWDELSREAQAFSPDSLAKAMLSNEVVRLVSKIIRGEFDYKANQEILTDKIYSLLENGLDDSIVGWNEAKQAEFHKFIKSQKRAARKTKKSRNSNTETTDQTVTQDNVNTAISAEMAVESSKKDIA